MKKKFLFVFALLSVLMFTGCGDSNKMQGTLSAPQEIVIKSDNGKSLIIFDEVENAEYYNIYINDVARTVKATGNGTIQFDASKIINLPQTYTIKIKAGANKYFESEFSDEHQYVHKEMLSAPTISVDGTILNWNKVENADFYDVIVSSSNPAIETIHRFSTNRFDFSNILGNCGVYTFKVKAISGSSEYGESIYSNQLTYTNNITLTKPYKLQTSYDVKNNEQLLTFVSSDNVKSFVFKVNNSEYTLSTKETAYFVENNLSNVYTLKLTSFVKSRSIRIDNSQLLNISVKADNDNERYVLDSDFSENVACQFYSILQKPTVAVSVNGANCIINITPQGSTTYLSGFAIYFDNYKYTTISQDVKVLQIPTDIIKTSGIRVQALSSNNNCYSSNLSDVKYIERNVNTLSVPTVKFAENQLTWENVENATRYYVEVSNKIFRHSEITTQTKLDLSNICNYGEYSVNVIAMDDYNGVENYNQSQASLTINYNLKLQQVTNVNIVKQADKTYLEFDGDANAYGYVMYLNNVMKDKLFISSPIDISGYVSVATSYNINVQAISVGVDAVESGEKSDQQVLQNIKTLSSPKLTITTEGNKYYLNIDVDENEASIASGYELWINYTSVVVETEFKDSVKEISSYFANAGEYSFMIQAKADKSNSNVKDSPMASIVFKVTKQLDVVTDILVQKSNEDKYILTFNEQTFAAKYLVTIKKAEDEQFVKQFELTSGYADISQYIIENGVYRVYVKAMALEGGSYTDSADSGNPYRVVKGETLSVAQNITFEKKSTNAGEIFVKWSKVENAIGYQVYVYYNEDGNNVLKESVYVAQTNEPSLNIGSGEYKCVGKEGDYSVQIKALGDNIAYENSQLSSSAYSYVMEKIVDFKRYSVFMYGNNYTYYVTKLDDLKNLLWYHYLYNKDTWIYNNSLEYNFKVYFDDSITITGKDSEGNDIKLDPIYELAREISEEFAVEMINNYTTNADKMYAIALQLLRQYPEIAVYSYNSDYDTNKQQLCFNEQDNVYMFRYTNLLNNDKLSKIQTTTKVFGEKIDTVATFDKRDDSYTFAIDAKNSVNVTTTEQLFIALQYNKKPNFVGDSSVAEAVYQNARFILREICSDNMTDYEKVVQIYNFLSKSIAYNHSVSLGSASEQVTVVGGQTMRGNVADFYLEGVLYNFAEGSNGLFTSINEFVGQTAVCDGLSKAFVVLCSIEGIDSIKVKNSTHAWNKVYLDIDADGEAYTKAWYVVDITAGIQHNSITFSGSTYQVGLHNYFLVRDTLAPTPTYIHKRLGNVSYVAETEYDYYESTICKATYLSSVSINQNLTVSNETDVLNLLMYGMLRANQKYRIVVSIDTNGDEDVNNLITNITSNLYTKAKTNLKNQYNCQVSATLSTNKQYIIMAIQSVNYKN